MIPPPREWLVSLLCREGTRSRFFYLAEMLQCRVGLQTALLKSDVFGTQQVIAPRVLDLQGWDSLQFEEEGSEYSKVSLNNQII